ncbi:MAG: MATE family efflux transporter [Gemmatimonadetes bacterium]|nr:MATE family efflux transporter [Gemmatimonadota bacterium]
MTRIAAPIVLAQVGIMLMGVVDTAMVGRVSPDAIAAVALAHIYWANLFLFGLGLLLVLDPVVSQAVGARDAVGVARGVQRGVLMAVALSVLMSLALVPGEWLFTLLRQPASVVPITAVVARWLIWGVLPNFLFVVFRQTLQAMGTSRAIVVSIVVGNVLNAFLNWLLIYGHWGFPALGPAGSAISTSIGRWVMLSIIVGSGWRSLRPALRPWRAEAFAPRPMLRMLRLGLPVAFQQWLEVAVFAMGGLVIGLFGAVPLAGHEIVLNLASITFMVPLGVGAAAAAMVGRAVGRDDVAAARRDAVAALSVGVGFMVIATLAFTLFPHAIAAFFSADPATVAFSASLLPIAGLFQIFDGMQCVSAGVLRGTGDTRVPMLLHLGGFWGVGIPLCLLLTFTARLGPTGVWWGYVGSLVVVAMLQMNRMRWRLTQDIKRLHFDH